MNLKSGFKTSEFWLVAVGVGGLLVDFARTNCDVDASKMIGLVVLIGGYIGGRSYVKAKTANNVNDNIGNGGV